MPNRFSAALRTAARRAGIPKGAIRSDLPEFLGLPSLVPPDLIAHWRRVLSRSTGILRRLPPTTGPRVAIVTPIGKGYNNAGYAAVMAWALRIRGADPLLIYCDGALAGCEVPNIHVTTPNVFAIEGPRPHCENCHASGAALYRAIGLPFTGLGAFLDAGARDEAQRFVESLPRARYYDFSYRGMDLGPHVEATVSRFFYTNLPPRGDVEWEVAKRIARGAVETAEAMVALNERHAPDVFVLHWGAYAARGTTMLATQSFGRRAVVWGRGYGMEETLMFGEGENAFMEVATQSTGPWSDVVMTEARDLELDRLLADRSKRNINAKHLWGESPSAWRDPDLSSLELEPGRPIVSLYTNIGFDTKLWYDTPYYRTGDQWVRDSIELFASRHEHLVIRVHPDEAWLPGTNSRQTIDMIAAHFPTLPPNVRIVPPESRVSSYVLAGVSKAVLLFGSLVGLELAALGHPVVVAGRTPYWQKGFTYDVHTREDYAGAVARLDEIARPDTVRTAAARRFAYYWYFMRNVPFAQWNHDPHPGLRLPPWWKVFRSLGDLSPGRDVHLDAICDHILTGRVAHGTGDIGYAPGAAR